jgi:hypothetical protein
MYQVGVRPSYATGFAQWPGMSEYPQLWRGLVGAWDMSLGQTGNKVFDLSGNQGNGVVTGFDWSAGKYGRCLRNTLASGHNIEMPADWKPLDGLSAFTVRAICNPASITADGVIFCTKQKATNQPLTIWFDNAATDHIAVMVTCSGGTTGPDFSTAEAITDKWYDIIVTYKDGEGVRLYVDGVEDTGFDGSGPSGTLDATITPYHIGNDNDKTEDFIGKIGHVAIWSRVPTASEIGLLYRLRMRRA